MSVSPRPKGSSVSPNKSPKKETEKSIKELIDAWMKDEDIPKNFADIITQEGKKYFDKIPQEVKNSWKAGTFVFVSALDGSVYTADSESEAIDEVGANNCFGYEYVVGGIIDEIDVIVASPTPARPSGCTFVTAEVSHSPYHLYHNSPHVQQITFKVDDGATRSLMNNVHITDRMKDGPDVLAGGAFAATATRHTK